jgi:hypothetical protein
MLKEFHLFWLHCGNPAHLSDLSKALYLSAHVMWNSGTFQHTLSFMQIIQPAHKPFAPSVAKHYLEASLHLGYPRAALDLFEMRFADLSDSIPNAALQAVRSAALGKSDSRAMILYARYILTLNHQQTAADRRLALDLAQEVSTWHGAETPGNIKDVALVDGPLHQPEAPWSVLKDAAFALIENQDVIEGDPEYEVMLKISYDALHSGAHDYRDPSAFEQLANHPMIGEWTKEWLKLKVEAATHGIGDACFDVARYYLEYWGWYPVRKDGKPPNSHMAELGFDWLELSAQASVDNTNTMAYRYQLLGVLLDENGRHDQAKQAIERGREVVEQYSNRYESSDSFYEDEMHRFTPVGNRAATFLSEPEPKLEPEQRWPEQKKPWV